MYIPSTLLLRLTGPLLGLVISVVLIVWSNLLAIPSALVEWGRCSWWAILRRLNLSR